MKLLKVIKNPVTNHLPVGVFKYGTSVSAKKVLIINYMWRNKFFFKMIFIIIYFIIFLDDKTKGFSTIR